jgi:hypothetical protein
MHAPNSPDSFVVCGVYHAFGYVASGNQDLLLIVKLAL